MMPDNQSIYFFGNSLVNYAEGGSQTNAPLWMGQFAEAAGATLSAEGNFGFLRNFADQGAQPNWSFDGVQSVYNPDTTSFASADFGKVVITPANFIQDQAPTADYFDEPRSPQEAMVDLVRDLQSQQPDAQLFVYQGWADMGPFGFPANQGQLAAYYEYNAGDYADWYAELIDGVEAQTGANLTHIPVASILSDLLTSEPLSDIPFDELYVDSAPHGTETLYFLAGMITYTATFGEAPHQDYDVPEGIHWSVQANFAEIGEQIATALNATGDFDVIPRPVGPEFDGSPVEEVPETDAPAEAPEPPQTTADNVYGNEVWVFDPATGTYIDQNAQAAGGADPEPVTQPAPEPEPEPAAEGATYVYDRSFEAPEAGVYRVSIQSDDPAVLRINGEVVLSNSGDMPDVPAIGYVELPAGFTQAEISYTEQDGGELLLVNIEPLSEEETTSGLPATTFDDIPDDEFEDEMADFI